MSKIEVNTVEPQCGTTLTLGGSGDTVTLGSGASQSGFGRTGTVDWVTTVVTTTPTTGVSGKGYFIDSSGGAKTVNLPASPSAGDIMAVSDYAKTAATNNITIGRNGSNIDGGAEDLILSTAGIAVTLVYVDGTKGWKPVNSNEVTGGPKFIVATVSGSCNTLATCGDFKIATFKGPGTFCVSCEGNSSGSNSVEYVVVAGGGGGGAGGFGSGTNGFRGSGGGGAGGFRVYSNTSTNPGFTSSPANPLNAPAAVPVSVQTYPVTVGGGGTAGPGPGAGSRQGGSGSNSIFSSITAHGGGGGSACNSGCSLGATGGSGGGSGANSAGGATGAAGNTPPVSPPQGNPGGDGIPSAPNGGSAGGGGGARAAGTVGSPSNSGTNGGAGGVGAGVRGFGTSGVNCGSDYYFSGGGGGGNFADGGTGGGGKAGRGSPAGSPQCGTAATANTGGGGGGAGGFGNPTVSDGDTDGGAGGSGIVIIRYKFQ